MGDAYNGLGKVEGRARPSMLGRYTQAQDAPEGLFPLRSLPKAIFDSRTSHSTLPLGYRAYVLDGRVVEGPLVR